MIHDISYKRCGLSIVRYILLVVCIVKILSISSYHLLPRHTRHAILSPSSLQYFRHDLNVEFNLNINCLVYYRGVVVSRLLRRLNSCQDSSDDFSAQGGLENHDLPSRAVNNTFNNDYDSKAYTSAETIGDNVTIHGGLLGDLNLRNRDAEQPDHRKSIPFSSNLTSGSQNNTQDYLAVGSNENPLSPSNEIVVELTEQSQPVVNIVNSTLSVAVNNGNQSHQSRSSRRKRGRVSQKDKMSIKEVTSRMGNTTHNRPSNNTAVDKGNLRSQKKSRKSRSEARHQLPEKVVNDSSNSSVASNRSYSNRKPNTATAVNTTDKPYKRIYSYNKSNQTAVTTSRRGPRSNSKQARDPSAVKWECERNITANPHAKRMASSNTSRIESDASSEKIRGGHNTSSVSNKQGKDRSKSTRRSKRSSKPSEKSDADRMAESVQNFTNIFQIFVQELQEIRNQQEKTNFQLSQLIRYNQNRDNELELLLENSLVNELESLGYSVTKLSDRLIYDPYGNTILEWDGIILAEHKDWNRKIMFLLETKQLLTIGKWNKFLERLQVMEINMQRIHSHQSFVYDDSLGLSVSSDSIDNNSFHYQSNIQTSYTDNPYQHRNQYYQGDVSYSIPETGGDVAGQAEAAGSYSSDGTPAMNISHTHIKYQLMISILSQFSDYTVQGIVGSPNIDPLVMPLIKERNMPYITFTSENYKSVGLF